MAVPDTGKGQDPHCATCFDNENGGRKESSWTHLVGHSYMNINHAAIPRLRCAGQSQMESMSVRGS